MRLTVVPAIQSIEFHARLFISSKLRWFFRGSGSNMAIEFRSV